MRDYQIRGLNWMISLYENGINGILADEMVNRLLLIVILEIVIPCQPILVLQYSGYKHLFTLVCPIQVLLKLCPLMPSINHQFLHVMPVCIIKHSLLYVNSFSATMIINCFVNEYLGFGKNSSDHFIARLFESFP